MPHRVLGVLPTASAAEIKAAFRKLALVHHPDLPTGCRHTFQRIQAAQDAMLGQRAGPSEHGGGGPSASHVRNEWQQQWHSDESRAEAERREFERLRREWQQDVEAERRRRYEDDESATGQDRKRQLFKVACAWVGLGALVKLAAMQMAWRARERAIADAAFAATADGSSALPRPTRVAPATDAAGQRAGRPTYAPPRA